MVSGGLTGNVACFVRMPHVHLQRMLISDIIYVELTYTENGESKSSVMRDGTVSERGFPEKAC